jgi:hypothetical protein
MSLPGLVAANNLSDVLDKSAAWTNLGRDITATVPSGSGTTTILFSITGEDIAALNGVRNTDIRDFVFIKGLTSLAQPRITTASQNTASGVALRDRAMPRISPTTSGNYVFQPPAILSGSSVRINNTPALSIATSPFSGSTALFPVVLSEFRPQADWRITESLTSGTINTPEYAIPFETNDFILFMKAGQN